MNWHIFTDDELAALHDHYHARRDYARAATCVVFGAAIITLIGADWRLALGLWVATLIPIGIAGQAARRHDDINGERGHRRLLDLLGVQRTRHVDDPACVCDACLYRRMRQTS